MPTADIINEWFREKLACAPLSRDTEAYNQVHSALGDLVSRLDAASGQEASAPAKGKKTQTEVAADTGAA